MTEDRMEEAGVEISKEFKLLTKTLLLKLKGLFSDVSVPYGEEDFTSISEDEESVKMSFLIPYVTKFKMDSECKNPHEYVREVINSTLKVLMGELNNAGGYECEACNLNYTGFSISPFGFKLEVFKDRLVAVKLRKVSVELLASFGLNELKEQALCDEEGAMPLKLPGELVFAALRRRRDLAEGFTIPNYEFDVQEIDYQLNNVKASLKANFKSATLVAS